MWHLRITNSPCPKQICIKNGYISKPGIAIIGIPHKVIIEIETTNDSSEEVTISS
ncbi:NusG domain II-containing protein [Bacillaceae bacterium S4-13-58]